MNKKEQSRLLTSVLSRVSRSFYLSMRVLPKGVREPVSLAYLLARIADTAADTPNVSSQIKLRDLAKLKERLQNPKADINISWDEYLDKVTPGEKEMLKVHLQAFTLFDHLNPEDKAEVTEVVSTLISGMEMDLQAFNVCNLSNTDCQPSLNSNCKPNIAVLKTALDLDRYIYLVAGCVGKFWTSMLIMHTDAFKGKDTAHLKEIGVRFGKALQLTNVLRDIPKDLQNGRCYLPCPDILNLFRLDSNNCINPSDKQELPKDDILVVQSRVNVLKAIKEWTNTALEHYKCAAEYALSIPFWNLRLRLSVVWPILIGVKTLYKLSNKRSWLNPKIRVKVSRKWVYAAMLGSIPACLCTPILNYWLNSLLFSAKEETNRI